MPTFLALLIELSMIADSSMADAWRCETFSDVIYNPSGTAGVLEEVCFVLLVNEWKSDIADNLMWYTFLTASFKVRDYQQITLKLMMIMYKGERFLLLHLARRKSVSNRLDGLIVTGRRLYHFNEKSTLVLFQTNSMLISNNHQVAFFKYLPCIATLSILSMES